MDRYAELRIYRQEAIRHLENFQFFHSLVRLHLNWYLVDPNRYMDFLILITQGWWKLVFEFLCEWSKYDVLCYGTRCIILIWMRDQV